MEITEAKKIIKITKQTYELIGSEFSNTRNRVWPEMELLVKKYVKKGNIVLDIGCGNGRLLEVLSEVDYLGVDGSQALITEAQKTQKLQKTQEDINFEKLDILELDKLKENNFEVIFMFASFNHIPSQELRLKVLADIKKLLKPGGVLIMTNWNMWQVGVKKSIWNYKIKSRKSRLPCVAKHCEQGGTSGQAKVESRKLNFKDIMTVWQNGDREKKGELYYRAFTKGELKKLFKKSGFKILENYYTLDGKKVCWKKGKNLVTVGRVDK